MVVLEAGVTTNEGDARLGEQGFDSCAQLGYHGLLTGGNGGEIDFEANALEA